MASPPPLCAPPSLPRAVSPCFLALLRLCSSWPLTPAPCPLSLLSPARSAIGPTCVLGLRFPLPTALAGPPSGLYGSVRPRPGGRARVRHGLTVVGTYGHVPGALSPLYVSTFVSPPPLTSAAGFASVFPSSTPVLDLFSAVPSSATAASSTGLSAAVPCGLRDAIIC